MTLSIIIPVINEEEALPRCIASLREVAGELPTHEIIVVDGGSADRTREWAQNCSVRLLSAPRGRGPQMNVGAAVAQGVWLLFLHADCRLSPQVCRRLRQICSENSLAGGCFSQTIDHPNPIYRWIAWTGNARARIQKIFYGDQGIFVRRDIFNTLGGYPNFPILEDVAFTEKLRAAGSVAVQKEKILCSARRWEKTGIFSTTLLYFRVLRGYRRGLSPQTLKEIYVDVR